MSLGGKKCPSVSGVPGRKKCPCVGGVSGEKNCPCVRSVPGLEIFCSVSEGKNKQYKGNGGVVDGRAVST